MWWWLCAFNKPFSTHFHSVDYSRDVNKFHTSPITLPCNELTMPEIYSRTWLLSPLSPQTNSQGIHQICVLHALNAACIWKESNFFALTKLMKSTISFIILWTELNKKFLNCTFLVKSNASLRIKLSVNCHGPVKCLKSWL